MICIRSRACAIDISKFCRDIPHGSGQQLKCLSNVIRDSKLRLEPKCDAMLRTRLEMFDMALKVVPINGIQDLWTHVSSFHLFTNHLEGKTRIYTNFWCDRSNFSALFSVRKGLEKSAGKLQIQFVLIFLSLWS